LNFHRSAEANFTARHTAALCLLAYLLLSGIAAQPAAAAQITLCLTSGTEAPDAMRYTDLAGAVRILAVKDAPPSGPGCRSATVPVAAKDVAWVALAAGDRATSVLALSGTLRNGNFEPQGIEPAGGNGSLPSRPLPAAPIALDLLPHLSARAFGIEERARIEMSADGLRLQCAVGKRHAGIVLRAPGWRLPEISATELRIDARGHGLFAVALNRANGGDPLPLGALDAPPAPATKDFALPDAVPQDDTELGWTILCPKEAAWLGIGGLTLEAPRLDHPIDRAAWVWPASRWRDPGDDLIAAALRLEIKRLSISVPVEKNAVVAPLALARFVAAARQHGIAVWVVAGDPRAVLPSERSKFVARAAIYTRYNAHAASEERLAGLEYDIEPYLEPGYALDPAAWQSAYVATIRALRAATPMAMEAVLPFWVGTDSGARKRLLEPLAGFVDGITVMDYRTDPIEIQSFAEPFLAWGQTSGVAVRIALENGPIADETIRYYRHAAAGSVWLVPIGGETAVVLLRNAAANPFGASFARDHDVTVPGSRISFLGDEHRLFALVPGLENAFRAWNRSFAGMSFNGLL